MKKLGQDRIKECYLYNDDYERMMSRYDIDGLGEEERKSNPHLIFEDLY